MTATLVMTRSATCCTCATLLASSDTPNTSPSYDFSDEKKQTQPTPQASEESSRRLPCCSRLICSPCQSQNPRFMSYCPFCQITERRSALPQGLRDPPAYEEKQSRREDGGTSVTRKDRGSHTREEGARHTVRERTPQDGRVDDDEPPAYCPYDAILESSQGQCETSQHPDTVHHLHPTDTLTSISLSYSVPISILRSHNALFSESLLAARRTILIPGSHYQGPSLSATPVESEEERVWKGRLRRFMVRSKCARYEVAEVYLKGALGSVEKQASSRTLRDDQDVAEDDENRSQDEVLEEAVRRWEEDERWERDHPFEKGKTGKDTKKRRAFGGSLIGQL